jgi:hypothetical protein
MVFQYMFQVDEIAHVLLLGRDTGFPGADRQFALTGDVMAPVGVFFAYRHLVLARDQDDVAGAHGSAPVVQAVAAASAALAALGISHCAHWEARVLVDGVGLSDELSGVSSRI